MNTQDKTFEEVPPQQSERQPEEVFDPVLQSIEDEYQRKMVPIDQEMNRQMQSLGRWGLVLMCMPFLLVGSLWHDHHRNEQVVTSVSAGELIDLRPVLHPTGFKPVVLVLQTSAGYVSLADPLSLPRGVALVREERLSGRSYICDVRHTQCAEIARPSWF